MLGPLHGHLLRQMSNHRSTLPSNAPENTVTRPVDKDRVTLSSCLTVLVLTGKGIQMTGHLMPMMPSGRPHGASGLRSRMMVASSGS
jgi:hypothetical protein